MSFQDNFQCCGWQIPNLADGGCCGAGISTSTTCLPQKIVSGLEQKETGGSSKGDK
jgi:hypothetical protein